MSRGRAIAGDAALSARASEVLDALATKKRERAALAKNVASMRARIEREKKAAGPFDVKLAPGGLMDCEFAAQFLVLTGLERVAGATTLETLKRAAAEGRVGSEEGERLVLSTALQSAILQLGRVAGRDAFAPDTAPEALRQLIVAAADAALKDAGVGEERAGVSTFDELAARLVHVQEQTRAAFESVLGAKVEVE